MKKIIISLIALFVFSGFSVFSQVTVDQTNINDLDINYCEIVAKAAGFSMKYMVIVDYGQKFSWKAQSIKGVDGKPIKFNSVIHALNFMDKNGWGYVNNYAVGTKDGSEYHYLFKKTKVLIK
jgi:hypothetical protein